MSNAKVTCGYCGLVDAIENSGILLACPGNVFCRRCENEIDATTGKLALLCGECEGCTAIKNDGPGIFEQVQSERAGLIQRQREFLSEVLGPEVQPSASEEKQ